MFTMKNDPAPWIAMAIQARPGTECLDRAKRVQLQTLVDRYGVPNVARAAGVSIQTIAKALVGAPMLKSTLNRVRSVLRP